MPNSPDERSGQPESPKTKPSRSRSLNVADFVESDRYKLAFESREHPDEMVLACTRNKPTPIMNAARRW